MAIRQGTIRGIVKDFRASKGNAVWTFRLEPEDAAGAASPILVELKGYPISGQITDGDVVELPSPASWREGKVLVTRRAFNHTLGMEVSAKRDLSLVWLVVVVAVIVLLVVVLR